MALTTIDDRGLKTPIDLLDNEKIRFGTGNDLEIFHDATHTYINNTTGDLRITDTGGGGIIIGTDSLALRNSARDENYLTGNVNGAVELYYNNAKKFHTISSGTVTTGHHYLLDSDKLKLGDSEDLQIYHDGTSNIIKGTGAHDLEFYTNNTKRFTVASNGNTTFVDDAKIFFGTGFDLRLWHDGSNSYITNNTGGLIIRGAGGSDFIHLEPKTDENGILIKPDGAVELYYDNSKKFETYSGGVIVTGTLNIPDGSDSDNRITLGDSGDLKIYHDGSHSKITSHNTGDLYLQSVNDDIVIRAADNIVLQPQDGENGINISGNGSVELYYDDSKKFETMSVGCALRGTIHYVEGLLRPWSATGVDLGTDADRFQDLYLHNDIDLKDDGVIKLGNGDDLQIYHDGSHSYIQEAGTGQLKLDGSTIHLRNYANSNTMAIFEGDEAVELYYNNVKKFETTSTGTNTVGTHVDDGANHDGDVNFYGVSSYNAQWDKSDASLKLLDNAQIKIGTGNDLKFWHNGTNSYINEVSSGSLWIGGDSILITNAANSEYQAKFIADGASELRYDGVKTFETQANGVTVFGSEGLKLYTENGNNTDTNSIVWRGGSNSQQANVAQIVAKQVSDWGGQLFIKVKKNDGALNDNYATVLNAKGDSNGFVELCTDSNARLQVQSTGFKAGATIPGDHATGGLIINSAGESSLYRSNNGIVFIIGGPQSGGKLIEFRHTSTGIGNISKGNSDTAINYNTTNSDRTLKKNFEDWTDSYWTGFKDLKPQKFNFLYQEDSDPKIKGYIAQDLASTFPEAYPKDAETDKYMFNPSGMVPYLMKTLQEAIVEIETLKTKVAALESS